MLSMQRMVGPEHREFRVQIHPRMRYTIATAIERERYVICEYDHTLTKEALHTQFPKLYPSSVPRKASGF